MEADAQGKRGPSGHLISEATPEVRELRKVRQNVEKLIAVVMSAAGGKPGQISQDVYQTLLRDVENERRRTKHEQTVARMMPKGDRTPPPRPARSRPAEGTRLQTK